MNNCVFCHKEIECTSNNECWCHRLPRIPIDIKEANCLCKSCLILGMAKCVNDGKLKLSLEQKRDIALLKSDQALKESVDYYYNDSGLMVFTKWYHLKRGDCCGNGCAHCPY